MELSIKLELLMDSGDNLAERFDEIIPKNFAVCIDRNELQIF